MISLLDGNALVAMSLPDHAFFKRTHRWLATHDAALHVLWPESTLLIPV